MARAAPLTVRTTQPAGWTEGLVLGMTRGSLLSSSPQLNQAFQNPWTLFSSPHPHPRPKMDSKNMVSQNEHGTGNQKTGSSSPSSAHFLEGSSPNSVEGHFAHLWSKAALRSGHRPPGGLTGAGDPLVSWQVAQSSLGSPPRQGSRPAVGPPTLAPSLPTMSLCQAHLLHPARISWPRGRSLPLPQCLLPWKTVPLGGQVRSSAHSLS